MEKEKDITIYYFSATGNSLKLALDISSHFAKSEMIKINATGNVRQSDADIVGFIFPVYMGGLPQIVREFLEKFHFNKDVYYFSIGTYYTYRGNAMSVVNRIMTDRGVSLSYSNYLPSVGNCLKEYEVNPNKRIKILNRAESYTFNIIYDLKNRVIKNTPKYYRLLDILHMWLFNVFFKDVHKKITLENTCINCRICEKICPMDNIIFKDEKPHWGANCEACHACVHWCPQNAINIGKSKGRLQYQNPAIKRTMLFNKK